MNFLGKRLFWIGCSDRITIFSPSFEPRGEIFFSEDGLVARVASEGVYLPSSRLQDPFRAILSGGRVDWGRDAVPSISSERVRQVLLDEWTLPERISEFANQTKELVKTAHEQLTWWKETILAAGLVWLVAIVTAVVTWIFAPHRLSIWAMPSLRRPKVPTFEWLAKVLTLFDYLGTTRRPLRAWLRKHREALYQQNFADRTPVKEREKYCDLAHDADVVAFRGDLSSRDGARRWITGVGGSGKSALAFYALRDAPDCKPRAPLPLLIDEDWKGALADHVVDLLRIGDRAPTRKMIEVLGAGGDLCLLVDSLSERGMPDAVSSVADAARSGAFKSIVVTSRHPAPKGQVWETFRTLVALPLTKEQVPKYIEVYASEDRRADVARQVAPLIDAHGSVSPLFLRFAIEQAVVGELSSTRKLDLVLHYVEALRAGKLDLNADDMLRAASIAATEAVRESLVPGEIEPLMLRGVLNKEADVLRFMNAKNEEFVDPARVIEMLIVCGLLNPTRTTRRLQFAYDPVAEHLAAHAVAPAPPGNLLKERIRSRPDLPIARTMAEIEAG